MGPNKKIHFFNFFSKTVGKTQTKRGSVTVTVTELPLVAQASEDKPTLLAARGIAARTFTYFAFFTTDFRRKERLLAVFFGR